jgi:putative methionine-R-sulfoxide reductase with GAF domain
MTEAASSTPDLQSLLHHIMARVQRLIPFDAGGIALYNAHQSTLSYHQTHPTAATIPVEQGILVHAALQQKAILASAIEPDSHYYPYDTQINGAAAVPLQLDGHLIGVLCVARFDKNSLTDDDLHILSVLGDQIVLTINATLSPIPVEVPPEEIAAKKLIARARQGTPLQDFLPEVCASIAAWFRADACLITIWDRKKHHPRRLAGHNVVLNAPTGKPGRRSPR